MASRWDCNGFIVLLSSWHPVGIVMVFDILSSIIISSRWDCNGFIVLLSSCHPVGIVMVFDILSSIIMSSRWDCNGFIVLLSSCHPVGIVMVLSFCYLHVSPLGLQCFFCYNSNNLPQGLYFNTPPYNSFKINYTKTLRIESNKNILSYFFYSTFTLTPSEWLVNSGAYIH
jgi:hypothetical protein